MASDVRHISRIPDKVSYNEHRGVYCNALRYNYVSKYSSLPQTSLAMDMDGGGTLRGSTQRGH